MEDRSSLVSALESEVGEHLRVVAEYTTEGYDLHYVRDDVRPKVEGLETEQIHDELVFQDIGAEYVEDLFDAGRLQCSVLRFEEMTAFHVVRADGPGTYVALDSNANVRLESFLETCERHLD